MNAPYNFDEPIERHGTSSVKYDMAVRRGKDPDLLPLWVADMDFRIPEEAICAIKARADHGIFGYTDPGVPYYEAVQNWYASHHGWHIEQSWFTITPGVVFALAAAVRAFTKPGDAVLIQPPVYYPFRHIVRDNNRALATAPLAYNRGIAREGFMQAVQTTKSPEDRPAHPYSIDFDAFEHTIEREHVKLFILCNPHNPVGRVWREEELRRMGEICLEHGVIVVSDEIHADFARPGFAHTPFAKLGDEYADICVTCTSPSKTFNLAGMQVSNIITSNEKLRAHFKAAVNATGFDNINTLGMVAAQACYEHGDKWLSQLKDYLEENLAFMNSFVAREMGEIIVVQPQSTYLTWLDCTGLGISHAELVDLVEHDAKLWLDHGALFGAQGEGFLRFNNATQQSVLDAALTRLRDAIRNRMQ